MNKNEKTIMFKKSIENKIRENCTEDGKEIKIDIPDDRKAPINKETREMLEKEYQREMGKMESYIRKYVYNYREKNYDKQVCLQKADEIYTQLEPIMRKFYSPQEFVKKFHEKIGYVFSEEPERAIEEFQKGIYILEQELAAGRNGIGLQNYISLLYFLVYKRYYKIIEYNHTLSNNKKEVLYKKALDAIDNNIRYTKGEIAFDSDPIQERRDDNYRSLTSAYRRKLRMLKDIQAFTSDPKQKQYYQSQINNLQPIYDELDKKYPVQWNTPNWGKLLDKSLQDLDKRGEKYKRNAK